MTTNNPDVFFLSNFNMQVLRELQKKMLDEVLSLNPIQNGIFDKNALIRFAKIKAIHAVIKSENIFTQSIFNDKLKALQLKVKEDNIDIQEQLLLNIETQNTFLADLRELYYQYIKEIFEKEIIEISNHKTAESLIGFPESVIKIRDIFPTKGFPKFGEPMHNYSEQIDLYINSGGTLPYKQNNPTGEIVDFVTANKTPIFNGWSIKTKKGYIPDPIRNLTKDRDYYVAVRPLIDSFYANTLEAPSGTVRFFIEKLHGAYSDFKPYSKNPVTSEKVPGYNRNLSNRAVFAAFIDSVSESASANYSTTNFLGSSEGFKTYQDTSRTISLTFSIVSDYSLEYLLSLQEVYKSQQIDKDLSGEIDRIKLLSNYDKGLGFSGMPTDKGTSNIYADTTETLWKKVTFLYQCMYPYYRLDGKLKETPMMRVRIGDYLDFNGVFTSLNIDTSAFDNMLETSPSSIGIVPFAVKVTINIDVVHDWMPNSNFYGFWNRKEFDNGTANPQTGAGLFTNPTRFGDTNTLIENTDEKDAKGSIPSTLLRNSFIGNTTDSVEKLKDSFDVATSNFKDNYENLKTLLTSKVSLKKKEDEVKKQIVLAERLSEVAEKLKVLYGFTSNISNNVSDIFNESLGDLNDLRNQAELVFGGVNANLNTLNDQLRQLELKGRKVGINVRASDEANKLIEKVNQLRFKNLVPSTLKNIL